MIAGIVPVFKAGIYRQYGEITTTQEHQTRRHPVRKQGRHNNIRHGQPCGLKIQTGLNKLELSIRYACHEVVSLSTTTMQRNTRRTQQHCSPRLSATRRDRHTTRQTRYCPTTRHGPYDNSTGEGGKVWHDGHIGLALWDMLVAKLCSNITR